MKQAKPVEVKTNVQIVEEAKASGKISKGVRPRLDQEFYRPQAERMAEFIGFSGEDSDQIDGMTCRDAKNFLTKTLHEIHVAVNFPAEKMPTAEAAAEHLMVADDPESVEFLAKAFEALADNEREAAKAMG